jgi:predicted RecB family nuclease
VAHDERVAAAKVEETEVRYPAGALIAVGRGRSVHLAVRAGRFGRSVGSGATRCGVRGVARPAAPDAVPCGSCENFEAYRYPRGEGPFAVARARAADAALPPSWVTKSDVTNYVRCPYAWWLLDQGKINAADTVDEFQLKLMHEGIAFHERVEAEAAPLELGPDEGLNDLFEEGLTLLGTPLFENDELHIRGCPDGIETAGGALLPIEVKSHKDVQRLDELELAFYWLLLEPQRTRHVAEPSGFVILRRNGEQERVEVPITPQRLKQVQELIRDVRKARSRGVRPRVCGCAVCSSVRRDEVARVTERNKDLTLLFGIGSVYAPILERAGIRSWELLLARDSADVVKRLKRRKQYVSVAEVDRWKHHAESWRTRKPVFFGSGPCVEEPFIALDLEYSLNGLIWLVGASVVDGKESEYLFAWSDDRAAEIDALRQLDELVGARPELPLVTWSGTGADLPRLSAASAKLVLPHLPSALHERHVDLFTYMRRSLRLPRTGLDLKSVATYFGIPRLSPIRDGLEAEMLYGRYLTERKPKKRAELRSALRDYNRDDLDALIGTARRLRELSIGAAMLPAARS